MPPSAGAAETRSRTGGARPRSNLLLWAAAAALVFLPAVAYIPVLTDGGFIWDDDDHVTENVTLRSVDGLRRIWFEPTSIPQYYPLTHTTFWVEYQLWGLNPLGYHATNLVLHVILGLLTWAVLRRLEVPGAWLAAAIFALHPVNVESVAWITERKNVLSGVLYMAAALSFLRFFALDGESAPDRGERSSSRTRWPSYARGCVLYVGALLSKTVTATLPAALALLIWWKRGRIQVREALSLAPLLVLGLTSGLVTAWLERSHVGAGGPDWDFSLVDRFLIAGRALWFYFGKVLVPHPLIFMYPRWTIDAGQVWQYAFPAAALGLVVILWRLRDRIGRGPLTATLFFGGTLFPALGFVNTYPMLYSFVADHFQYLASLGPIALLAAGVTLGMERLKPSTSYIAKGLVSLGLLTLLVLTWRQGTIYEGAEALWRDTIEKNPSSWMAHNNLGRELSLQGRSNEAMAEFEAALTLRPDHPPSMANVGNELHRMGRPEEALPWLERSLELEPLIPDSHLMLGGVLVDLSRWEEAERAFRTSIELRPSGAAHAGLGMTFVSRERIREGVEEYRRARTLDPDNAAIRSNMAAALWQLGDIAGALAEFRSAVDLAPTEPTWRLNLAGALNDSGDLQGAVDQLAEVVRLAPDAAIGHQQLAVALHTLGETADALQHLREALRLDPSYVPAAIEMAWILSTAPDPALRDGSQAESLTRGAIAVMGENAMAQDVLAAALAEQGRFEEAVTVAGQALAAAERSGDAELAGAIGERIASYRAGTPWRDSASQ